MSQNDNIPEEGQKNLDDYIKQLEEKEQSKRKGKLRMTVLAIALAGAGLATAGYFYMNQGAASGQDGNNSMPAATAVNAVTTTFLEVDASDASLDYALTKLSESNVALIVNKDGVKDTFMRAQQVLDRIDYFSGDSEGVVVEGDVEENAEERDYSDVKFGIAGNREVNKRLLFNLQNDAGEDYLLSFGDGSVYKVTKSTGYSFKKPGTYQVKLQKRIGSKIETLDEKEIVITGVDPDLVNVSQTTPVSTPIDPQENSIASVPTETKAAASDVDLTTKGEEVKEVPKVEDKKEEAKEETKAEEKVTLVESFEPKEKEVAAPEVDYSKPFIYALVQKKPSFPGGESQLNKFISRNIKYPRAAKRSNVEGKVFVQFVIAPDGSIKNEKVLKGIGSGCDEEALKVIRTMPKWTPGEQDGRKINVVYSLPISFKLR